MKLFLVAILCSLSVVGLAQAYNFKTVVIDPGHGGHDKGGKWGRVYEKHLALDTAVRLETHLKSMGFRTVMTRRSDHFVSLPARVRMANKRRRAIFISIHYNYTWKRHVSGIETFYYSKKSYDLAADVHRGMLRHVRAKDRKVKYARYYVIRNCKLPAILVEGGFVSNSSERRRMKSASFRNKIARGIAEGVARFRKR